MQKIKSFENTSSVNDLFEDFQSRYDDILNRYAPLRTSKTKKRNVDCSWLSNHIKNLISKRNRLHKAWSKNKNNVRARFRFESVRRQVEIENKKLKIKFHYNKFKNCIGDSRKAYKLLNDLKGITNTLTRTIVSVNGSSGDIVSEKPAIAIEFNYFFLLLAVI